MTGTSKHPVVLSDEQRAHLRRLIRVGRAPARKLTHARILLKADQGLGDKAVAEALDIHLSTAWRVRLLYVREGLERALEHGCPSRVKPPRLDGRAEAHLLALARGDPPAGRARWTLRLLARTLVELEVVPRVAPETVRRALQRGGLRLT
jgi:transposase